MVNLKYAEIYITNVCNINCPECNQFNNYNFSGHQLWSEYKNYYVNWSKKLDIDLIGILGGEPMVNPEFIDWVIGIAECWPNSKIKIISNGTRLDQHPELYQVLQRYNGRVFLEISEHNYTNKEKILTSISNFLHTPIKKTIPDNVKEHWLYRYNIIKDSTWPDCTNPEDFFSLPDWIQQECQNIFKLYADKVFEFVDSNNVKIWYQVDNEFTPPAVIFRKESNTLSLHNSNPEKAISACVIKGCHQFNKGKLYKCPVLSILPEFVQQFPVETTTDQKELIYLYQPAEENWAPERLAGFVNDIKRYRAIPQCSLCSESVDTKEFSASTKKIVFVKNKI